MIISQKAKSKLWRQSPWFKSQFFQLVIGCVNFGKLPHPCVAQCLNLLNGNHNGIFSTEILWGLNKYVEHLEQILAHVSAT